MFDRVGPDLSSPLQVIARQTSTVAKIRGLDVMGCGSSDKHDGVRLRMEALDNK